MQHVSTCVTKDAAMVKRAAWHKRRRSPASVEHGVSSTNLASCLCRAQAAITCGGWYRYTALCQQQHQATLCRCYLAASSLLLQTLSLLHH
jgi:hypothetical protein